MKRLTVVTLVACIVLAGCKDTPAGVTSSSNSFVRPASNIVIKAIRTFAPTDAIAGGGNQEYYIVRFSFTNDLGYAFVPSVQRFYIEDIDRIRYRGMDSGSTALVGITNTADLLKPGESHEYTVGFRVPNDTAGTLVYDPTES